MMFGDSVTFSGHKGLLLCVASRGNRVMEAIEPLEEFENMTTDAKTVYFTSSQVRGEGVDSRDKSTCLDSNAHRLAEVESLVLNEQ